MINSKFRNSHNSISGVFALFTCGGSNIRWRFLRKVHIFGSRQNNLRFFCGSKGRSEKMGSVFVVGKGQNRPTALFIHQYVFWCSQWKILMDIYSAIVCHLLHARGRDKGPHWLGNSDLIWKVQLFSLGTETMKFQIISVKSSNNYIIVRIFLYQLRKKKRYFISTNEEPTRKINREENIWRSPYIESSETRFLSSGVVNVQIYIVNLIVYLMCAILSKYVYKNV